MNEVEEIVRRQDRDRYLSCLFAPDDKRPHLLALYAFNAEILRVRDTVAWVSSACSGGVTHLPASMPAT